MGNKDVPSTNDLPVWILSASLSSSTMIRQHAKKVDDYGRQDLPILAVAGPWRYERRTASTGRVRGRVRGSARKGTLKPPDGAVSPLKDVLGTSSDVPWSLQYFGANGPPENRGSHQNPLVRAMAQ